MKTIFQKKIMYSFLGIQLIAATVLYLTQFFLTSIQQLTAGVYMVFQAFLIMDLLLILFFFLKREWFSKEQKHFFFLLGLFVCANFCAIYYFLD